MPANRSAVPESPVGVAVREGSRGGRATPTGPTKDADNGTALRSAEDANERRRRDCPEQALHASDEPRGYMQWHEWADRKNRTHKQSKCPGCGLWLVWTPRTPESPPTRPCPACAGVRRA